jgi:hypothetical protein
MPTRFGRRRWIILIDQCLFRAGRVRRMGGRRERETGSGGLLPDSKGDMSSIEFYEVTADRRLER